MTSQTGSSSPIFTFRTLGCPPFEGLNAMKARGFETVALFTFKTLSAWEARRIQNSLLVIVMLSLSRHGKKSPRDCCFDNMMTMGCWGTLFLHGPKHQMPPWINIVYCILYMYSFARPIERNWYWWEGIITDEGCTGSFIANHDYCPRWPRRMLKRTEGWNHGVMLLCLNIMDQQ
jgi:hypothetical protein